MPITTYESKKELQSRPIENAVIRELLDDIFNFGEDRWIVVERITEKRSFFKSWIEYWYEVYWSIDETEQQVINFPSGDGHINTAIGAAEVAAFLLGIRMGLKE